MTSAESRFQSQPLKQDVAHLTAAPIAPNIATRTTSETPRRTAMKKTKNKQETKMFSAVSALWNSSKQAKTSQTTV